MKRHYLEVTFRKGKPLAAYLYLPRRENDRADRTQQFAGGVNVDFASDGRPIGVELTTPTLVTLEQLNQVLAQIDQPPVQPEDLRPLEAA